MAKNYYKEIDDAIKSYEDFRPYHTKSIDWICNRIDWCWRFRHIKMSEMSEFVDRICNVMKEQNKSRK